MELAKLPALNIQRVFQRIAKLNVRVGEVIEESDSSLAMETTAPSFS